MPMEKGGQSFTDRKSGQEEGCKEELPGFFIVSFASAFLCCSTSSPSQKNQSNGIGAVNPNARGRDGRHISFLT